MKYFKRINHGNATVKQPWEIGVIYPEDSYPDIRFISTSESVYLSSDRWQKVSAKEYWEQEFELGMLVKGGYYTVKESGVIFKHDGTIHSEYYLGWSSKYSGVDRFCRDNGCFTSDVECYRIATDDEIDWLEACNKADKFISKEKFMKSKEVELLTNMKDKKIIGYILKDPQYYKAASMIVFGNASGSAYWDKKKPDNRPNVIEPLRKAEVLDLWFEPVYEENTFESGDYVKWEGVYSCIGIIDNRRTDVKDETYTLKNVFTSFRDNVYTHCSVKHLKRISKEEYEQQVLDFLKEGFIKMHNIDLSKTYNVVFKESSAKNVKFIDFKLAVRDRSEGFWAGHTYNWFNDHEELDYQLVVITSIGTFRPDCIVTEVIVGPEVTIRDYEAKFTKDSVSFGCQTYSKEFVLQLGDFLEKSGLILDYGVQVMKVVKHFREQK